MKFLLDASTVIQVIKGYEEEKTLRLLGENCILDLTRYEVGNALWKEHTLHRTIGAAEFREALELFRSITLRTKILSIGAHELVDAAEVAQKERMTFYDASYIVVAKTHDLTLVTEDTHLAKAASKHVKTASGKEIT
jgi:predicted nucleic acid-binding protein